MKLGLELASDRPAPGEEISGRVIVLEGGSSRSLKLTLGFHERTAAYSATPYSTSSVLHEGELASGQEVDFTFQLPPEAPPSVKAGHSELLWELEATADRPGLDPHVIRRIEVLAGDGRP